MNHLCETWRFCHNKYEILHFSDVKYLGTALK